MNIERGNYEGIFEDGKTEIYTDREILVLTLHGDFVTDEKVFEAIIQAHATGYKSGVKVGESNKQHEIKMALGF